MSAAAVDGLRPVAAGPVAPALDPTEQAAPRALVSSQQAPVSGRVRWAAAAPAPAWTEPVPPVFQPKSQSAPSLTAKVLQSNNPLQMNLYSSRSWPFASGRRYRRLCSCQIRRERDAHALRESLSALGH